MTTTIKTTTKTLRAAWVNIGGAAVALIAWLVLAALAMGDEPITINGNAGDIFRLTSDFKGEVEWIIDARLTDDKRHEKIPAIKRLVVVPKDGGTYRLIAISAEGTKPVFQEYILVAKGGPGPGPGPDPIPVPDTLATRVAAAYAADVAAGKGGEAERKVMQLTFAQAGSFLEVGLKFDGKKMVDFVAGLVLKGKLPATMGVVHAHLTTAIPQYVENVTLTAELKALYVASFADVAVALALGPTPGPGPGPSPVPVAGFKVLIVEETAKRTPAFVAVISSPLIRDYLDSKATKQGWRVQDQNVVADKDLPWVKDLAARPRTSVPWVVIAGEGKIVFEGPLPIVSPAETLLFFKRFGG